MAHIWNFLKISLYPVGAILICGFIVWLCQKLFMKLLGRSGYRVFIATSLIGTPIHELGHAAMCLLCGWSVRRSFDSGLRPPLRMTNGEDGVPSV